MCATCGCGHAEVTVTGPGEQPHDHPHDHAPDHAHDHAHDHGQARTHTVELEQAVLARNDHLAAHNRDWLSQRDIVAVNLMSSPGAGKTSLLERTIREGDAGRPIAVVEGDQETAYDAQRIRDAGASAVQVNTGAGCHLDAAMVAQALDRLAPSPGDLVFLENVGNLVCPAMFDLGELCKVVVVSVTEGDDKPLKYPHMFAAADLVVVNKTDLLPYVDFDLARCEADARKLNPDVGWLPLSVRDGDGLDAWYRWLQGLSDGR